MGENQVSATEQQPRRRSKLTTILVLLAGFGIGYISSEIAGFMSCLASEYSSAVVIREITAFVAKNRAWPNSWETLGMERLDRVRVNWSLDVNTCDRYPVMMSVGPETEGFYTYPHAERQLDELWQLVLKVQDERFNQSDLTKQ